MDVQMAQEVYDSDPGNPDVILVLRWKEWDNTLNEVKYSLNIASHQLSRQPSQGALNAVARNIESVQVSELASGNLEEHQHPQCRGIKISQRNPDLGHSPDQDHK